MPSGDQRRTGYSLVRLSDNRRISKIASSDYASPTGRERARGPFGKGDGLLDTVTTTGKPPARRRRYVEKPDIRKALLDAAEQLITEEGYAAATVRQVASKAGLKHQAVFYYFGSQDDLLLGVVRRAIENYRERLTAAVNTEHPLRALWSLIRMPGGAKLSREIVALANHSDAIRVEIAKNAVLSRKIEADAIRKLLEKRGIEQTISPEFISVCFNGMAQLLNQESVIGVELGHESTESAIEVFFDALESDSKLSGLLVELMATCTNSANP